MELTDTSSTASHTSLPATEKESAGKSYETVRVNWERGDGLTKDSRTESELIRYGRFLVKRGLVSNTFGNIVLRAPHASYPETGVLYTKCRGVSLEEMRREHIVVTEVYRNRLLCGATPPSNGHQMSRAIMACLPDVKAVIHTHADVVIAYFAVFGSQPFHFLSVDTALVLGRPPKLLPRHINLEEDSTGIEDLISDTTCMIMPNHGMVTVGSSLSEAYHRHTAFIAELQRLTLACLLASSSGQETVRPDEAQTQSLYGLGQAIIYGRE